MIDAMLSIAAGFVVLAGSLECRMKRESARLWSGIAHTRGGGRRSSPGIFTPITNKFMAGVCKKDGRADPDAEANGQLG